MNKNIILLALAAVGLALFSLGWFSASAYDGYSKNSHIEEQYTLSNLQQVQNNKTRDKPSPYNWISKDNVLVYNDEVIIKIKNPEWAIFTDTKSMDPVIDSTSKAIQIVPKNEDEIHVGDIVAYKSKYKNGIITHRVIDIGYDTQGWYAIVKGDNNESVDPGKVRFEQIKRVVIAIIY